MWCSLRCLSNLKQILLHCGIFCLGLILLWVYKLRVLFQGLHSWFTSLTTVWVSLKSTWVCWRDCHSKHAAFGFRLIWSIVHFQKKKQGESLENPILQSIILQMKLERTGDRKHFPYPPRSYFTTWPSHFACPRSRLETRIWMQVYLGDDLRKHQLENSVR